MELGLLRALWRAAGRDIESGATVDVGGLPPGFGGPAGVFPLLDALQDRQFVEWKRASAGRRLAATDRPLARFEVDWKALDRRRRADLAKLDAMQQYAYFTGCRRGYVLRYFGDPAARTTCGGCDNCLGVTRKVVRAAGAKGKRTTRAPKARSTAAAVDVTLDAHDEALLARLRTLRSSIARDEQVPAYVVFADRTLLEMAVRRPKNLASLGEIRGVGPVKLERYGTRFLDAVRAADETEAA